MKPIITLLIFASALGTACSKAPTAPFSAGRSADGKVYNGGKVGPDGKVIPGTGDSGSAGNPQKPSAGVIVTPTEISLENTKFKGEESKLEAIVKYAGSTSARIKLTAGASEAKFTAPQIIAAKSLPLEVELYEGQKLRFKGVRPATTVEKEKVNSFKIEDCSIQKLPWTGEAHENLCTWSVSDVKN